MSDALDIIESLAAEEIIDLCIYWQNAQAFIKKWTPPKDSFEGLGEELVLAYSRQKEASDGPEASFSK
jgi:hypothetical protein